MSADIDNSNLVFGVHWNVSLADAKRKFSDWGCNGIHEFTKERVMNGNEARKEVVANAKSQNAKYLFVGNYDWGTTADSAVYRFRITSWTGPLIDGTGDVKFAVNWSGHD